MYLKLIILENELIYILNIKLPFLVVINAQLERKQKLALELSAEKQKLEHIKKNVASLEEDIIRRNTYSKKICKVNTEVQIALLVK